MNRTEIREMLEQNLPTPPTSEDTSEPTDIGKHSSYLGSFMSLDPCGRYHHAISPNGLTPECADFWSMLDEEAESLGGWIESGEGDPTDIFFCMPVEE